MMPRPVSAFMRGTPIMASSKLLGQAGLVRSCSMPTGRWMSWCGDCGDGGRAVAFSSAVEFSRDLSKMMRMTESVNDPMRIVLLQEGGRRICMAEAVASPGERYPSDAGRSATVCARSKIYERGMIEGFLGIGGCLLETETGQKFVCDAQRHWTMMTDRMPERDRHEVVCSCGLHLCESHRGGELQSHVQLQDRGCQPWQTLLERIADARKHGSEVFAPFEHMRPADMEMIVTLPAEIGQPDGGQDPGSCMGAASAAFRPKSE